MLVSVSSNAAPPLKRPAGLASTTLPVNRAPFGIAVFPSTSIASLKLASNFWPGWLIFDPTGSSRTTAINVSAGTTMGRGRGAGSFGADLAASCAGEAELLSLAACCWSALFWQPTTRKKNADKDAVARRRFMNPSTGRCFQGYYDGRRSQFAVAGSVAWREIAPKRMELAAKCGSGPSIRTALRGKARFWASFAAIGTDLHGCDAKRCHEGTENTEQGPHWDL